MSLSLVTYPVFTASGIINNIFPGYLPVLVNFKREDIVVVSVTQGANDKILINVVGDITGDVSVSESVYLYSEGSTFIYDLSAKIITITFVGPNTEITIDSPFIEISSGGYMNYFQDWLTEVQLVDPSNSDILILDAVLSDDGDNAGNVEIDTSIAVDQLDQRLKEHGGEVTEGRVKFAVQYRESYRDNREEAYILIVDTPIIIVFSAEEFQPETIINQFDTPTLWNGYTNGISYAHSDANYLGNRLQAVLEELDINKDVITSDIFLLNFEVGDYGFLFVSTEDTSFAFDPNAKYGRLIIQEATVPDFLEPDFASPDFETN